MRTTVTAFIVLAGVCCAQASFAQGTARSLDIQPGARENAMGAGGVALETEPAEAMWWNPAALAFANGYDAQYTRAKLVPGLADNVIYQHVAAGAPVGKRFGVGASGTFLSFGAFSPSFLSSFTPTEHSLAFAAACRILPDLAFGVTGKYVRVDPLPGAGGSTVGFDFGGLYRTHSGPLRASLGFNVQNVGPEMKFDYTSTTSPLSRNLKVGGALTWPVPLDDEGLEAGGVLLFDYNQSLVTHDFRTYNGGAEAYIAYRHLTRVAVRGGYYDDPLGEIQDATFGAGVQFGGITFDYAEIPQASHSGLPRVKKWTVGLNTAGLVEWFAAK